MVLAQPDSCVKSKFKVTFFFFLSWSLSSFPNEGFCERPPYEKRIIIILDIYIIDSF